MLALKVKEEEHLKIYGGLREGIGIGNIYLHDPVDAANILRLRFWVGDLDLPERRDVELYQ